MKLLDYILKHKLISFIIILLTIFLPILVIHFLFSFYPTNNLWVAKWSAGELLSYFGSIIGAIATIVAVVITIIYTKRSQDEQNILQVKPYLQSEYFPVFSYADVCKVYDNKITYITLGKGIITSSYEEPSILKVLQNKNYEKIDFLQTHYIFKYTLKNVGANSSTNIKWNLNNTLLIPEFAISKDETKNFIMIIKKNILENDKKDLIFEFIYDDVLSMATYSQKEIITIIKLSDGLNSTQKIEDILSPPIRLK